MILSFVRRLSLPVRLLMLVLLALGVVGTPLASALDDVHMLGHDDVAAHAHESDDSDHAAAGDSDGEQLLHALVHCGHCHGHGSVLPNAPLPLLPAPSAQACPDLVAHPTSPTRVDPLLRPPIA